MNTEIYVEVLTDRVPEEEAGVQTDAHMDRPPSPIFVPKPVSIYIYNLIYIKKNLKFIYIITNFYLYFLYYFIIYSLVLI